MEESQPTGGTVGQEAKETLKALDELFSLTDRYRKSSAFRELLDFVARFRFYAPYNALLVHVQKPGATFVAPASRWRHAYGRQLLPTAQPLVILQPMGPIMFVFDVSDTSGPKLPPEVEEPFAVRRGNIGDILERTVLNAQRDGVNVSWMRQGSQRAGCIQSKAPRPGQVLRLRDGSQAVVRYEIILEERASAETQYATLVHELSHLYCGHLGTPNSSWWPDRQGTERTSMELEAESVSFLVCRRRGIDSPSERYLSDILPRTSEVTSLLSLERVMVAAGLIERMGNETLPLRKKSP